MKIAVIGAYGKSGRAIIAAAERHGHTTLAIGRTKHDANFKNFLIKDLMALTKVDLAGYDAIIDATSAWSPETFFLHTDGISHIANLLRGTKTRLLKVGGAGTLYLDETHTRMLKDRSDYPADLLLLANVLVASLARMRSYSDLAWTYVTPAHNYDVDGLETDEFHIDGEEYLAEKDEDSYISYADFAEGVVSILEQNAYVRQRITIVGGKGPSLTNN